MWMIRALLLTILVATPGALATEVVTYVEAEGELVGPSGPVEIEHASVASF